MTFRPFHYISLGYILVIIITLGYSFTGSLEWWWSIVITLLYLGILFYGVVIIRANFFFKSHNSFSSSSSIALTFDDGPNVYTDRILDILKDQKVKATFFCIGNNINGRLETFKRIDKEGHLIGNHSRSHSGSFDWQSSKKMLEEIIETNNVIKSVIGKTPKLFRPPYGITNPNLAKAVKRSGMYSIGWSVRSFDTVIKDRDKLLKRILKDIKGGDIILLHDSMLVSSEILTDLIVIARKKGFNFAPIDEVLGLDAYEEDI